MILYVKQSYWVGIRHVITKNSCTWSRRVRDTCEKNPDQYWRRAWRLICKCIIKDGKKRITSELYSLSDQLKKIYDEEDSKFTWSISWWKTRFDKYEDLRHYHVDLFERYEFRLQSKYDMSRYVANSKWTYKITLNHLKTFEKYQSNKMEISDRFNTPIVVTSDRINISDISIDTWLIIAQKNQRFKTTDSEHVRRTIMTILTERNRSIDFKRTLHVMTSKQIND